MLAPRALTRLSLRRLPAGEAEALGRRPEAVLGALGYGGPQGLAAPLLLGGPACADVWCGAPVIAQGRCGAARWRHDGDWLYGTLAIDTGPGDLTAPAQALYRDVFATLRETGFEHLLRLWNYLPDINADGGGLERYRQFNVGRQQAFFEAGQAAFEGAPAACALGTRGGPLCLHFLAGRVRPHAVENPRQVSAYRYPRDYGPRSPSFSRAALFDAGDGQAALLVSGTSSIVGHVSVHPGDVRAQTRETLANLRAVLDAAHARTRARFALHELVCTVYVRRAEDAATVREVLEAELGSEAAAVRAALFVQADICRSDLLVEIEAHAFAAGEVAA